MSCAGAMKDRQQMLVAVEGEGGFLGMAEACPAYQVTWSVLWGAGDAVKVSVCPLQTRNKGRVRNADAGMSINNTFLFTHFLSSLS